MLNIFLTHHFSLFIGREHFIWEALHLNQNYEPISNMPPKPTCRFTFIPTSIDGRGGRQGRSFDWGAGSNEDDRDSMPLIQQKSSLPPLKCKAEGTPKRVCKRPTKEPVKELAKPTSTVAAN